MDVKCSVCLDSEQPAKQMMINEAVGGGGVGGQVFLLCLLEGELHTSLLPLITSHLPLTLPQPLSSPITSYLYPPTTIGPKLLRCFKTTLLAAGLKESQA